MQYWTSDLSPAHVRYSPGLREKRDTSLYIPFRQPDTAQFAQDRYQSRRRRLCLEAVCPLEATWLTGLRVGRSSMDGMHWYCCIHINWQISSNRWQCHCSCICDCSYYCSILSCICSLRASWAAAAAGCAISDPLMPTFPTYYTSTKMLAGTSVGPTRFFHTYGSTPFNFRPLIVVSSSRS